MQSRTQGGDQNRLDIWTNPTALVGLVHSGTVLKYNPNQAGAPQTPGQVGSSWTEGYPTLSVSGVVITAASNISQGFTTTPVSETVSTNPGYRPGPDYTSLFNNFLVVAPTASYQVGCQTAAEYFALVNALQQLGIDPPSIHRASDRY